MIERLGYGENKIFLLQAIDTKSNAFVFINVAHYGNLVVRFLKGLCYEVMAKINTMAIKLVNGLLGRP